MAPEKMSLGPSLLNLRGWWDGHAKKSAAGMQDGESLGQSVAGAGPVVCAAAEAANWTR